MRRTVVVGVVALVALTSCKQVKERLERSAEQRREREARAAEAPPPPRPPAPLPTGPGLEPGEYRVTQVQVAAMPTKASGLAWDAGETYREPDLGVVVTLDDVRVADCKLAGDALAGACALDALITIGPGSVLAVRVVDRDLSNDDPIGDAVLDTPSRWGVGMALPMQPTDQLVSASITLAAGPTWWSRHGDLVMLVIGVGGALGLWIALRQHAHRAELRALRRTEDAKLRGCPHCETRIPIAAIRCGHCGAPQPPVEDAA